MYSRHAPNRLFLFAIVAMSAMPTFGAALPDTGYLAAIGAVESTPLPDNGRPVVLAIVDDGVRLTHSEVAPFIWTNPREIPGNGVDDDGNGHVDDVHGWDLSDDDADPTPPPSRADYHHGTHLAGVVTDIARAVFGASATRAIRIMPVKVISDQAESSYLFDAYRGVDYATANGADIILTAWGLGPLTQEGESVLGRAAERGEFVVASAGNFPEQREQYPAAYPGVLAVAALDEDGRKLEASNFGQFVDLSAPGYAIDAAIHDSDTARAARNGTSVSAAIVAAAAALVKAVHPAYTRDELKACILSGAAPITTRDSRLRGKLGAGRVNIQNALRCDLLAEGLAGGATLSRPAGYLRPRGRERSAVTWTIEPAGTFNGLRFTPVFNRSPASRGRLEFRADPGSNAPAIATFELGDMAGEVFVPGSRAQVTFVPDPGTGDYDWLFAYKADTIRFSQLYCKGIQRRSDPGVIEDGSSEAPYAANSDCKWLITAPRGKVIQFDFTEMATEPLRDLIYFFDGAGTQEKIMAVFSGTNAPPQLTTWHNQVLVWFVTDGQNELDGWRTEYRFVDPPERPATDP